MFDLDEGASVNADARLDDALGQVPELRLAGVRAGDDLVSLLDSCRVVDRSLARGQLARGLRLVGFRPAEHQADDPVAAARQQHVVREVGETRDLVGVRANRVATLEIRDQRLHCYWRRAKRSARC